MWGTIPEWLTFAAVYIWAGIWFYVKMDAADDTPLDMNDGTERWVPLICIFGWPIVALATPFTKS